MTQISGDNDTPLAFIPDIAAFEQAFDGRHYVPVPDDWMLAITDVVGSTARITAEADPKRGEQIYRDINFIAAAGLTAVQNATGAALPAVFGGDGSITLVPPNHHDTARTALAALAVWSKDAFGIDLRVGMIPVHVVKQVSGGTFDIVRQRLSHANLYHLRGRGLWAVDELLKTRSDFAATPTEAHELNLTGLSCSWDVQPSRNGVIQALIVVPKDGATGDEAATDALMRRLFDDISAIAGQAQALTPKQLRLGTKQLPHRWWRHIKAQRHWLGWLLTPLRYVILAAFLGRWFSGTRAGERLDADIVRQEITQNTDAARAYEGLRILLDVSTAAAEQIEARLRRAEDRGEIVFGASRHDGARFTCQSNADFTQHVHFLDGTGKGFWAAARARSD